MTSFCTFPLSPTDRCPQDSPRPAHQQAPVWNQFWRKIKKAAPGWQGRLGNQRLFQRTVMGRRLTFWRTKRIPRMSPSSRCQILRQAPHRGVPSQAKGVSSNRMPWKWMRSCLLSQVTLHSCVTPVLGSHPHVLSVLHPQVQSVVRHVHSQLAPTSTICPA